MTRWSDIGGRWGDDDPYDWKREGSLDDSDLGLYGFVFLLAILTMTVVALAVI